MWFQRAHKVLWNSQDRWIRRSVMERRSELSCRYVPARNAKEQKRGRISRRRRRRWRWRDETRRDGTFDAEERSKRGAEERDTFKAVLETEIDYSFRSLFVSVAQNGIAIYSYGGKLAIVAILTENCRRYFLPVFILLPWYAVWGRGWRRGIGELSQDSLRYYFIISSFSLPLSLSPSTCTTLIADCARKWKIIAIVAGDSRWIASFETSLRAH